VAQRIEIGPTNVAIVLRLPTEKSVQVLEPIVVAIHAFRRQTEAWFALGTQRGCTFKTPGDCTNG
jgi:hypothetical protein